MSWLLAVDIPVVFEVGNRHVSIDELHSFVVWQVRSDSLQLSYGICPEISRKPFQNRADTDRFRTFIDLKVALLGEEILCVPVKLFIKTASFKRSIQ